MKEKTKVLLISLLFIAFPLAGESISGWTAKFSGLQLLNSDNNESDLFGKMSLTPSVKEERGDLTFDLRGSLEYSLPSYDFDFSLKEFSLSYASDSFWKVNLGRFYYLPGSSEFFSNTNYFAGTDFIQLIENQGDDFYSPGDMLQLVIAGESLYCIGTMSLTPIELSFIEPSSSWFPRSNIPSVLYSFGGDVFYLNDLSINDPEEPPVSWSDLSAGIETGWTTYLFDLSVQYYHGWMNEYLYLLDVDMNADDNEFDVTLQPVIGTVDSIGLNWLWTLGSFHFWLDGAYSINQTFVDSTLSFPGMVTLTAEASSLETTAGLRYDFYWQNMTVLLEWKETSVFSEEDDLVLPYFNSALAVAMTMELNDYRHQPGAFLLYSLEDESWMGALQWKYNMKDYLSLEGTAAWLQGEDSSFFGQFEQEMFLALNLVWRH